MVDDELRDAGQSDLAVPLDFLRHLRDPAAGVLFEEKVVFDGPLAGLTPFLVVVGADVVLVFCCADAVDGVCGRDDDEGDWEADGEERKWARCGVLDEEEGDGAKDDVVTHVGWWVWLWLLVLCGSRGGHYRWYCSKRALCFFLVLKR